MTEEENFHLKLHSLTGLRCFPDKMLVALKCQKSVVIESKEFRLRSLWLTFFIYLFALPFAACLVSALPVLLCAWVARHVFMSTYSDSPEFVLWTMSAIGLGAAAALEGKNFLLGLFKRDELECVETIRLNFSSRAVEFSRKFLSCARKNTLQAISFDALELELIYENGVALDSNNGDLFSVNLFPSCREIDFMSWNTKWRLNVAMLTVEVPFILKRPEDVALIRKKAELIGDILASRMWPDKYKLS